MKRKVLFAALAVMVALGATAQNKAIELLAEKYTDREGFTVVNLDGEMIAGMGAMMGGDAGQGTITLDDGSEFSTTDLLEDIESVIVIASKQGDDSNRFLEEAELAVEAGKYSPIVSTVAPNGAGVKVVSTDLKRGKYRGNSEYVVLINGNGNVVFVRIIGKIDTGVLGKMLEQMN